MKVNADKSTFCALEITWGTYLLKTESKIRVIRSCNTHDSTAQRSETTRTLPWHYRDLWARWSDMLAPLTALVGECGRTKITKAKGTKKVPWHWDEVHQRAFNHVKATIARDVVLAYSDYSEGFEIYTDASSKQLEAVITQKNRPIAFFSQKLSIAQRKYSVTKIELWY